MDWVISIDGSREEFNEESREAEAKVWNDLSIYKVPHYMRTDDSSGAVYKPQMVSIGPYHVDEEHLKPMNKHKLRALIHLLSETNTSVNDYINMLNDILPELMDSYEQLDERWLLNKNEFLRLMVLDGCFMIEIFRKNFTNYAPSDPIFSEQRQSTVIEYIKRDMLLMENQLPLLVLEKLATVLAAATGVQISSINSLLLNFYFPYERATYTGQGKHMLDIVRQSMVQSPTINQVNPGPTSQSDQYVTQICVARERTMNNNRCVTILYQAGINFERSATHSFKDITFQNGNLYLPTIIVEQNFESIFLNLIAFEQLHLDASRFMSSYFLFMGGLITSANDVKLLRDREIIKSSIACDDTIQEIIVKLTKGLSFSNDDHLYQLQQELNNYYMISKDTCKRKVDRWYLKLYDTYFDSPWSIIKLSAGIIFLAVTILSAVYQILKMKKIVL